MNSNFFLIIFFFICLHLSSFVYCQETDTLSLFYDINKWELSKIHKKNIDDFFSKNDNIIKIAIFGYTDFLGTVEYNKVLSQKRSTTVKKYISNKYFPELTISSEGLGVHKKSTSEKATTNITDGIAEHRKVKIIISKEKKQSDFFETDSIVDEENIVIEEETTIPIFRNIDVDSIKVGDNIVLNNILFRGGTHRILDRSLGALHELLWFMRNNPRISIRIEGHICCHEGEGDGYDMDTGDNNLSVNRANAVYRFLVSNGISKDRLSYKGYGASRKLFPEEKNAFEQNMNRRVEIVIVDK